MKRTRRKFTSQYKKEIVDRIESRTATVRTIAAETNINENLILRWLNDARAARVAELPTEYKERRKDYSTTQELKAKIAELYMQIEKMQRSGQTWIAHRHPDKEV